MNTANYSDIMALSRDDNERSKIKLILTEISSNENLDVPDPYYGGNSGFINMLDIASDIITSKIKKMKGKLFLIPTTLGDTSPLDVMPTTVKNIVDSIDHFIVENEKSARRFIKKISPEKSQESLKILLLDKYSKDLETNGYLDVCENGISMGLLSDAGVPAVADPGSMIVKLAHEKDVKVVPLVGPSSILMAIMGSGMNGQNFAFNGYLPIDKASRKKKIKELERMSFDKDQSQLFIETPYRNMKMLEDLIQALGASTRLCVAVDITLKTEYIKTKTIAEWKRSLPEIHKRPAIFIIHK